MGLFGAVLRLWVSLWSCSDKFQQCFDLKVPQVQFIDRLGYSCYAAETCTHSPSVQLTAETRRVPLLGWFLTCPLLSIARCQFTVVKVVDISVVAQRQFPLVLTIQISIEIPQLLFDMNDWCPFVVVDIPVVMRSRSSWSGLFRKP